MKTNFTSNKTSGYLYDNDDNPEALGLIVTFENTTDYSPYQTQYFYYRWNFGDGTTSDTLRPGENSNTISHTYTQEGKFDVSLIVWSDSIVVVGRPDAIVVSKTVNMKEYISVRDVRKPVADFFILPSRENEEEVIETVFDDDPESDTYQQFIPVSSDVNYYEVHPSENIRATNISTGSFEASAWTIGSGANPNYEKTDLNDIKFPDGTDTQVVLRLVGERGDSTKIHNIKSDEPAVFSRKYKDENGNVFLLESKLNAELYNIQETLAHEWAGRRINWNRG